MARLTERDRLSLRYLCDRSFFHFVKIVGGFVKQGGDLSPHLHGPICRFAQDKSIKRKAIFMPRIWRKSTTYTKWRAVWEYLQNNEIRMMLVSENQEIGKGLLEFITRQIANNEMLRWLYPELLAVDAGWTRRHRWSATQIELPRQNYYSEPTMSVLGVGAAAQSRHVDLILLDDLVGKKAMESPVVLESVIMWFNNVSELLVNPDPLSPTGSEISMVGTFWAPGDLGTYIVEKCPEFHVRITPALHFSGADVTDTGRVKWIQHPDAADMETNYPENVEFSTDHYKAMLADPEKELVAWAQHMNMPHKTSLLTKFSEAWFRHGHWEEVTRESGAVERQVVIPPLKGGGNEERHDYARIPRYMVIDPGGFAETKLIKKGSRNAIVVGGQPLGSIRKVVFDAWAGRLKEPSDFVERVFAIWAKWKPRHCYIETVGQAEYIKRDILERARQKNIAISLSSTPPATSANAKDDRITALIPRMENGEIVFMTDCGAINDIKTEIKTFPNSLTRDLADCLGWLNQLVWTRQPMKDMAKVNADRNRQSMYQRNEVTGY